MLRRANLSDQPVINVANASDWFRYLRPENIYVVDEQQDPPELFAFPPGEAQAIVDKLKELIDCE